MISINTGDVRKLPKPSFVSWIVQGASVKVGDKPATCYLIDWKLDNAALDEWALHIRRHYLRDDLLAQRSLLRRLSQEEYLKEYVIPQRGDQFGPQAIAGDFAEILVMDLMQYCKDYVVARYKHHDRLVKDRSEPGCDVVAYKFDNGYLAPSRKDELQIIEVKSAVSKTSVSDVKKRVNQAIDGSEEDPNRVAMTLNYMSNKAANENDTLTRDELIRFLNKADNPFVERYGIAVTVDSNVFSSITTDLEDLQSNDLSGMVFLIQAKDFRDLVYDVYSRCVA